MSVNLSTSLQIEFCPFSRGRVAFRSGLRIAQTPFRADFSVHLRAIVQEFLGECFAKILYNKPMPPAIPDSLGWAHPLVQEWFVGKFGTPTEPQEQGWPHILSGSTTLISAPTGSGKTLAAFLACIDALVRKALRGDLTDRTETLYVSPLKALGNDIQKNLEGPLAEITALAGEKGLLMPEIRVAVRTGDTLMHERQRMLNGLRTSW